MRKTNRYLGFFINNSKGFQFRQLEMAELIKLGGTWTSRQLILQMITRVQSRGIEVSTIKYFSTCKDQEKFFAALEHTKWPNCPVMQLREIQGERNTSYKIHTERNICTSKLDKEVERRTSWVGRINQRKSRLPRLLCFQRQHMFLLKKDNCNKITGWGLLNLGR